MDNAEFVDILNVIERAKPDRDLDDFFPAVLSALLVRLRAEYGAIYLVDHAGSLTHRAAAGAEVEAIESPVVLDLDQKALLSRQALAQHRLLITENLQHYLAAPLIVGDTAYGVIRLLSATPFGGVELVELRVIARLVASVVHEAKLSRIASERNQYFEHLIYQSPDPICVVDRDGRIQHVNREFELLWRTSKSKASGRRIDEFYEFTETARDLGREMWNSPDHTIRHYATNIRDATGNVIPVQLSASRLTDSEGRATGSIGIFQDIRDRIRAEEERLRSERLALIGRLAGTIVHDIKHDIGALFNWIDALERGGWDRQELPTIYDGMREAASHAVAKLQDLLLTGRPSLGAPELVSIQSLLRSFQSDIRFRAKVSQIGITIHLPPRDVFILADREQMRQVFMNLFSNSMDAIDAKSRDDADRDTGQIDITAEEHENRLVVSWRDDGCGFRDEHREDIFAPFFTMKQTGVGLGLFVARTIVEQFGGDISARPPGGGGALFRISLPILENRA